MGSGRKHLSKTIKIAIVDDVPVICQLIEHYVLQWAAARDVACAMDLFHSAEAFSFEWEVTRDFDVVLLDIEMTGANGMILARQIRSLDTWMRIVFITGTPDFVYEGYEVSALNYLLKPVSQQKLEQCLDKALEAFQDRGSGADTPVLLVEHEGANLKIAYKELLAVEAQKHHCVLYTKSKNYTVKMGFSDLVKELGEAFIQCHRSYCVNLEQVSHMDRTTIYIDGGLSFPISRQQFQAVQQAFIGFYKRQGRELEV